MAISIQNLTSFLCQVPPPGLKLPALFHSTKGTNLCDILNEGKLDISPCPVFAGEGLLYFFVGRPAYKNPNLPISDFWLTPVVFVFQDPLPLKPRRIFPFDSGAFVSKKLGEEFADLSLERFQLDGDYENIAKIIKVFFGSVSKYIRAEAKTRDKVSKSYDLGPKSFPILALTSLLTKPADSAHDDRNCVIEVQFDQPVPFNNGSLKGIVLAEDWMSDVDVAKAIAALDCLIEPYPLYPLSRDSYYSKIYECCERIQSA